MNLHYIITIGWFIQHEMFGYIRINASLFPSGLGIFILEHKVVWEKFEKTYLHEENSTKCLVFVFFFLLQILNPTSSSLSAILLCRVQHGIHRGAGCFWEHLWPAVGAVWEFLRSVQKRYATQPGRPVPLLCFIQQLRAAGPEKVLRGETWERHPVYFRIMLLDKNSRYFVLKLMCNLVWIWLCWLLNQGLDSKWKKNTALDVVQPNVREDLKTVVRKVKQISSDRLEEGEGLFGFNLGIEAKH